MVTNEMDAKLISQGTQVESVDGAALVPVATAEGQPQQNITLANLADSMGNAVPAQQTTEQVSITGLFAKTSDGKMVELTSESVASVMAGLMNTNKLFPMGYKGYINDADSILDSGIYRGTSENVNTPRTYGLMVVYKAEGFRFQEFYSSSPMGEKYVRFTSSTTTPVTWSAWQRIDNFGCNTSSELASMVAGLIGVQFFISTLQPDEIISLRHGTYVLREVVNGESVLVIWTGLNKLQFTGIKQYISNEESSALHFYVYSEETEIKIKNIDTSARTIRILCLNSLKN